MTTADDELRELERRWAKGEIEADVAALDALATDDFTLVGPAGFVLDKPQWLERYRRGDLLTRSLSFEDARTRVHGIAAVTIGRHIQQAEYRGHPANGEFRATHIAIRDGSEWRLVGMHLSPIGGPPPFAARLAEEGEESHQSGARPGASDLHPRQSDDRDQPGRPHTG